MNKHAFTGKLTLLCSFLLLSNPLKAEEGDKPSSATSAAIAEVNAMMSAAPTSAGIKYRATSNGNEQMPEADKDASSSLIKAMTTSHVTLSPKEQLEKEGSGVFFKHTFEKLAIAQPPSFSWLTRNNTLLSDNLRVYVTRGREQMQIDILSYDGPGTYEGEDFQVQLLKDGKRYTLAPNHHDKITIENDEKGWITGTFTATLAEGSEGARLDEGVFRISDKKPLAATMLNEMQLPRQPLFEAALPFMKQTR